MAMQEGAATRLVVREARGSVEKYACRLWCGGGSGHGGKLKEVMLVWMHRGEWMEFDERGVGK